MAASREVPSGGGRGTVVGQISEMDTATGKQVQVLRTQTARYTDLTHLVLDGSTEVFALDPADRYALVQNMQFGWMDIGGPDPGRFTPLPGFQVGREVFWAAWLPAAAARRPPSTINYGSSNYWRARNARIPA